MTNSTKIYGQVVAAVAGEDYVKATKYISEKLTIKATRRKKSKKQTEIVVTIGKPNYAERKLIKLCKKAGEKFPIKKIQLKFKKGK
jgi:hypothetical protein